MLSTLPKHFAKNIAQSTLLKQIAKNIAQSTLLKTHCSNTSPKNIAQSTLLKKHCSNTSPKNIAQTHRQKTLLKTVYQYSKYLSMPSVTPLVRKSTGQMQPFSSEKLKESLMRSGADQAHIDIIIADIEGWIYEGISTKAIYTRAFALLKKKTLGVAARYKFKKAMMELGPTGHP